MMIYDGGPERTGSTRCGCGSGSACRWPPTGRADGQLSCPVPRLAPSVLVQASQVISARQGDKVRGPERARLGAVREVARRRCDSAGAGGAGFRVRRCECWLTGVTDEVVTQAQRHRQLSSRSRGWPPLSVCKHPLSLAGAGAGAVQ